MTIDSHAAPDTTMFVDRALRGDRQSLSWVIQRLNPLLISQAEFRLQSKLRRYVDPQDLVNEAWFIALPQLRKLIARDGRMTPVLLRYLSTTILHRIHKLGRRKFTTTSQQRAESLDPADGGTGAFTTTHRIGMRQMVREAIQELPVADREILVLRGIEQHPSKIVAEQLELSVAAVDKRYSRALARLRAQLPNSVLDDLAD